MGGHGLLRADCGTGIGLATCFRLYSYRRWVFLMPPDAPLAEQLEPYTTGLP